MEPRNPFEQRTVISRRGGRVKKPLSRDGIVAVALKLLRREGLEGMSLRKVATVLDTGAASLYAYVADLRELQTLVLDKALEKVEIPAVSTDGWRKHLASLLESYVTVLAHTPDLPQIAMNTVAAGPNALRIMDSMLGLLEEAGVDRQRAAWAVDLLNLYITAIAAEQNHRKAHSDALGQFIRVLGAVAPQDFPRIHASRESLMTGGGLERFHWAIDVILHGVLQTPIGAARASAQPK